MTTLIQLAGKLESAIRESRGNEQVRLKEFGAELDRRVQVIRASLNASNFESMPQNESRVLNRADAAAATRLREFLKESSANSVEACGVLVEKLTGTVARIRLDALVTAVSAFDFDGARLTLDDIMQESGLDGK